MKCLVGVKRVVDYAVKVRAQADQLGVELKSVKHSMNPFCEIALEESVRLKEKGVVGEIVVVSVGGKAASETLRTALANGADRAIHVQTEARTDQDVQPLAVAKILQALVKKESPKLVFLGKQSIDDDSNQTGQMLAGLLGWNQATFASEVKVRSLCETTAFFSFLAVRTEIGCSRLTHASLPLPPARTQVENENAITVTREIDGGLQVLTVKAPLVLTADLRLNEPRYAALPAIMKAKKKPLDTVSPADLGVDLAKNTRLKTLKVTDPPKRKGGWVFFVFSRRWGG